MRICCHSPVAPIPSRNSGSSQNLVVDETRKQVDSHRAAVKVDVLDHIRNDWQEDLTFGAIDNVHVVAASLDDFGESPDFCARFVGHREPDELVNEVLPRLKLD